MNLLLFAIIHPGLANMKKSTFLTLSTVFLLFSCMVVREDRVLKKTTKAWRDSPEVLHAYADSPFAGMFLTLRENQRFDWTTSGMLQSFQAGSWAIDHDTISLFYMNSQQDTVSTERLYMNRERSTLTVEGQISPVPMRYTATRDF